MLRSEAAALSLLLLMLPYSFKVCSIETGVSASGFTLGGVEEPVVGVELVGTVVVGAAVDKGELEIDVGVELDVSVFVPSVSVEDTLGLSDTPDTSE